MTTTLTRMLWSGHWCCTITAVYCWQRRGKSCSSEEVGTASHLERTWINNQFCFSYLTSDEATTEKSQGATAVQLVSSVVKCYFPWKPEATNSWICWVWGQWQMKYGEHKSSVILATLPVIARFMCISSFWTTIFTFYHVVSNWISIHIIFFIWHHGNTTWICTENIFSWFLNYYLWGRFMIRTVTLILLTKHGEWNVTP